MGAQNEVEFEAATGKKLFGPFEYDAVAYNTFALYDADLPVKQAAGWDVVAATIGDRTVNPGALVITYRKPLP